MNNVVRQRFDYIANTEEEIERLVNEERALVSAIRDPIRSSRHEELDTSNGEDIVPWTGLALSGGGIRSATFNLGVLQALSKKGLLHWLDYISTVSGGGYIGSSLTWYLSRTGQDACKEFLLKKPGDKAGEEEHKSSAQSEGDPIFFGTVKSSIEKFLTKKSGDKAREEQHKSSTQSENDRVCLGTMPTNFPYGVDAPGKILSGRDCRPQKELLSHLRHRGNYLAPGNGLTLLTLIGVVIRNSMINLLLWFPLLTAVTLGVMFVSDPDLKAGELPVIFQWIRIASLALFVIFILMGILFSVANKIAIDGCREKDALANQIRFRFDQWGTHVLEVGIALGIIYAIALMGSSESADWRQLAVSGFCIIGAIAVGASTIFKPGSAVISRLLVPVASGLLATGLFVLAFNVAYRAQVGPHKLPVGLLGSTWVEVELDALFILIAAGLALVIIFLTNLNVISIARFYRDRLKEAYMPGDKDLATSTSNKPTQELYLKDVYLPDHLNDDDDPGPYPIINTNVILVDSKDNTYRTRGGDNFILSPLFCGSKATGWQYTGAYNKGRLTLSTAMAISGAAINPHAGPGGQGSPRNRAVSFLMSALNLRLGVWMPNPVKERSSKNYMRWIFPNFLASAIYGTKSAIGRHGYCRESIYLQLSDGGHFDNLGLYELLRRQLGLIIVSDASADPEFTFSDLRRSLRYAEMDLDTEISFDGDLTELMPHVGNDAGSSYAEASKGYLHATIRYKGGKVGELYYIKSTMIQEARVRTRSYKFEHPEFPDETTADQFFDEAQFAAYRDLGYNTATDMIEHSNLYPLE